MDPQVRRIQTDIFRADGYESKLNQQVLVHGSIYQGNPFWAPISDARPNPPSGVVVQIQSDVAMGQNPVPPVNILIPTKMGSTMGGEFTNPPKCDPKQF